ncbi:hypothetical protein N7520_002615 [Penicillium odoratum]|uniref:uncharacterized protein n=1 Tax=Penicillium odoratum TaxID=1167516 RepID=UPI00254781EC|nr:uncharacterized protein N7520_002615 [Penicillium odoratum]KAJ5772086.1 hypothetical protein N7520_002615 [Penicillium odoratum]
MAQDIKEPGVTDSLPDAQAPAPIKHSVRSFKKKYAKTKQKFELGIRENENLIREELRIEDLSKRIQEQNDQLLEVLMEFNESVHVSPSMRYGLTLLSDAPFLPTPEHEITPLVNDATLARTALKEAKAGLASGSFSPSAYRQVEESIKRNKEFAPALQFSDLIKVPHTEGILPGDGVKDTGSVDRKLGYFTPEHETEHYLALDAKLGDQAAILQLARIPDPPTFAEREKEASMRNPASVFNWLRRNQPQTLQDHEVTSEKSASRPSNARTSKRAPVQRKEEETIDEDGIDVEPTPKGKRKRDEDTGYRPKGGNSRSKKKKDDSTPNRSSKKA